MTRDEFANMVKGLLARGQITLLEASKLTHALEIGSIAIGQMSLPLRLLPEKLSPEEFKGALRSAAAFLTPTEGSRLLATQTTRPRITSTPPEVKELLRERLRNHFRGDFEGRMRKHSADLARGGNVDGWHAIMMREQRSYIARQMTAGLGRALTVPEMDEVNRLSRQQNTFLKGFADLVSARRILGRDLSQGYLTNRSLQYGGVGWGAWFRGNEIAQGGGDGKIIIYIAVDDPRTCSPCHEAAAAGPYLPGSDHIPYPGEVCRGHGLCRCKHKVVFDMETWRRLKGLPPERPKKPPKTETEKEAQLRRIEEKKAKRADDEAARLKAEQNRKMIEESRLLRERQDAERAQKLKEMEAESKLRKKAESFGIGRFLPLEEIEAQVLEFQAAEKELAKRDKVLVSKREVEYVRPSVFDVIDEVEGLDSVNDWLDVRREVNNLATGMIIMKQMRARVDEWVQEHKLDSVPVLIHGMTDVQDMFGVDLDGVTFRWPEGVGAYPPMINSILDMYISDRLGDKVPKEVWAVNKEVIFTEQANKADADNAIRYKMPNFTSLATGGDGNVVVYRKFVMDTTTLVHEGAHNLANVIYGSTDPTVSRKGNPTEWAFMRQDFAEEAVRDYGKVNPNEDFATAFEEFNKNKNRLETQFPHRFALVEKILKGGGEDNARAESKNAILKELVAQKRRAKKGKEATEEVLGRKAKAAEEARLRAIEEAARKAEEERLQRIAAEEERQRQAELASRRAQRERLRKALNRLEELGLDVGMDESVENIEKRIAIEELKAKKSPFHDLRTGLEKDLIARNKEEEALRKSLDDQRRDLDEFEKAHNARLALATSDEEKQRLTNSYLNQRLDKVIALDEDQHKLWDAKEGMADITLRHIGIERFQESLFKLNVEEFGETNLVKGKLKFTPDSDARRKDLLRRIGKAQDFLQKITANLEMKVDVRQSLDRASGGPGRIAIERGSDIGVIIHELGHNVEYKGGAALRAKRLAFFESRTQGDKVELLRELFPTANYGRNEKIKRDKWIEPYMGAIYDDDSPNKAASEIISMGVQMLYENPLELIQKDPEYFDFLIGYLRGEL